MNHLQNQVTMHGYTSIEATASREKYRYHIILKGELAIFCVDAELRKRSKGKHGICDLMVKLCEKFALGYPNAIQIGVDYKDIRKELVNMEGGRNLENILMNWFLISLHQTLLRH